MDFRANALTLEFVPILTYLLVTDFQEFPKNLTSGNSNILASTRCLPLRLEDWQFELFGQRAYRGDYVSQTPLLAGGLFPVSH